MEAATPNSRSSCCRRWTDFAFLMPIVFLFGRMDGVKTLLSDCDTGWHIRTGEWIRGQPRGARARYLFFSKPGGPWFAWEWLSDVLFAWLNGSGGLAAVVLFAILLLCVDLHAAVPAGAAEVATPSWRSCVTMVAAAASSVHWLARPHLFTLFSWCCSTARSNASGKGSTRWPGCRTWRSCRRPRFCGPTCTADSSWAS